MDNKKFLDYNGLLYFYSLLNSKFLKTETDPVFTAQKSNIVSTVELNPAQATTYSDGYKHITLQESDPTVPAWAKVENAPLSLLGRTDGRVIYNMIYVMGPGQNTPYEISPLVSFYSPTYLKYISYQLPQGSPNDTAFNSNISLALVTSPHFLGTPTAPTAVAGTNTTLIATTEFVSTAVSNAIAGVTSISYDVIAAGGDLPSTGTAGVIYLKPNSGASGNSFDEYIWVNNTYELLSQKELDLSNYWNSTNLVAMTNADIDSIVNPT